MGKTIGMVISSVDNYFFSTLANEAQKYLKKYGYSLFILSSANNMQADRDNYQALMDSGVDGILCASDLNALTEELLPVSIPVVCIDRRPDADRRIPWVGNDDEAAICEATKLLLEKGCRHILLSPGYSTEYRKNLRVAGYSRALKDAGMEVNTEYILTRKGEQPSHIETEEVVLDMLAKGYPVDAIITSSDRAVFGAMTALRSIGVYAPEEMKLISFDNSPYSAMATPSITAIERRPAELAQKACDILLKMIRKEENVEMESIVPVNLVLRDSTR